MKKYILIILCLSLSGCFVCKKPYIPEELQHPVPNNEAPPILLFEGKTSNKIRVETPEPAQPAKKDVKPAPKQNKKASTQYLPDSNVLIF